MLQKCPIITRTRYYPKKNELTIGTANVNEYIMSLHRVYRLQYAMNRSVRLLLFFSTIHEKIPQKSILERQKVY